MRRSTIIFITTILSISAYGQEIQKKIETIDQYASELDSLLEPCGKSEEPCGWYMNTLVINEDGRGWRAVGTYREVVTFWYSDQPEFAKEEHGDEKAALVKVSIRVSSTYELTQDIYFKDGIPVLFYREYNDEYVSGEWTKFHFDETNYINGYELKYEPLSGSGTGKPLVDYANKYMSLFLLSFTNK